MKRFYLICLLIVSLALPSYGQFWISFGWDSPECDQCARMEATLRLSPAVAGKYHKIIHKYGKKIEREARRDYRYWDSAAERIYDLRMRRDREIERLLSPAQFDLYIRLIRATPSRIHDYRGWYDDPRHPGRVASRVCVHFEDCYWGYPWKRPGHAVPPPPHEKPGRVAPPPPPREHPVKPKHPGKPHDKKKDKRKGH